jgi:hypothetical protein
MSTDILGATTLTSSVKDVTCIILDFNCSEPIIRRPRLFFFFQMDREYLALGPFLKAN